MRAPAAQSPARRPVTDSHEADAAQATLLGHGCYALLKELLRPIHIEREARFFNDVGLQGRSVYCDIPGLRRWVGQQVVAGRQRVTPRVMNESVDRGRRHGGFNKDLAPL